MIEAITQTGTNEAITAKIKECEEVIKEAKTFLESYERDYSRNTITEKAVKEKIDDLKDYLLNPENVQRSKFILSQYIEKIEISNEKIKATFKVAFANIGESSDGEESEVIAEYREDKSIKRKLLIKNYSDIGNYLNNLSDPKYSSCEIEWEMNDPLDIFVYNRDFRSRNIMGDIAGVFTLGEATIDSKIIQ